MDEKAIAKNNTSDTYVDKDIVFFDGVCKFCNAAVNWIWRRNKQQNIFYASLQSEFARKFLKVRHVDVEESNTIYFYTTGKLYAKSTAVLKIMSQLEGGWKFLGRFLILIPSVIRDPFYDIVAYIRYRLAGRREQCRIPDDKDLLQDRFIA